MRTWPLLSHTLRSLRRSAAFSATVVLTLTLGIGAATGIFTVVNGVLLRSLPYPHPEQLVAAWHDLPPLHMMHAGQTTGTYFAYRRFTHTLADIALVRDRMANITDAAGRAEPQRLSVAYATASLFTTLGLRPLAGRGFTAAEDIPKGPDIVVISEGLWRARFAGDPAAVGKMLVVNGRAKQIIGVLPAAFQYPSSATQLWLPMQLDPNNPAAGSFNAIAVARLRPGVTAATAERDLARVLPRMAELFPVVLPGVSMQAFLDQTKPQPRLVPLRDDMVADVAGTLWIVAAATVLLILVTCANVANLLLVRADARHRELCVRAALGAGRARVVSHLFAEAGLLAGVSAVLGIGAAAAAVRLLVHAGPAEMPRLSEIHVDATAVAFALLLSLLVALATSAIPAARFAHVDLLGGVRDGGRGGTVGARRQRARGVLVAAQMALALVALVAAGLLVRSFEHVRAVRPGFDAEQVATLWIAIPQSRFAGDSDVMRFYARLTERVAQLPGVSAVGLTSRLPLETHGTNQNPLLLEGTWDPSKPVGALYLYSSADAGYFRAMRMPLVAGRGFDTPARQSGDEVLVSRETAVRLFHDSTGRAAIGKRFVILPNGIYHTIVGVVGSARDTSLLAPPTAAVYLPMVPSHDAVVTDFPRAVAIVARTGSDVDATTRAIQRVIREADPTLPTFDVRPMSAVLRASTARLTFAMIALGAAALVTLALGVVGLYGVIAYVVQLRTRELGVRLALGATPQALAAMVTRQGLVLCAAGMVAGVGLVVAGARLMRSFLFEVAPLDPLTLLSAGAVLVGFALAATWMPARRAARIDPTEALRAE